MTRRKKMKALFALAILVMISDRALAEKIQPFDCKEVQGRVTSAAPGLMLDKRGKVYLVCPFDSSMNGFRVRFIDGDGTRGNQSFKVWVFQTSYLNDFDLATSGTTYNQCEFLSNFYFQPGIPTITCPILVTERSYQVFIIELWSRGRDKAVDVRFLGIETF
jgi:hypothetical protein